jgi:hypothetical protein
MRDRPGGKRAQPRPKLRFGSGGDDGTGNELKKPLFLAYDEDALA